MNQYFINKTEVHKDTFHKMLEKNIHQFENELKFDGNEVMAGEIKSAIIDGLIRTGSVLIYDCKFEVLSTTYKFES